MANEPDTKSFFPGVRKGLHVDHFAPLANQAGEKRQRIDFTLSLADGQLLGIPEWLSDAVALVQKGRSSKDVSPVQLDGVTLHAFTTPTHDKEVISISAALLKGFTVQRASKADKADGSVVDVEICFQCYVSWNPRVWDFCIKYFNATAWFSFGTTQAAISFGPPKSEEEKEAEQAKARAAERQPSLPGVVPANPTERAKAFFDKIEHVAKTDEPTPAEEEGGDTSFVDVAEGAPFRYNGERYVKLSPTEAVRQLNPDVRLRFSKATRVNTGVEQDRMSAAAGDDASDDDLPDFDAPAEDVTDITDPAEEENPLADDDPEPVPAKKEKASRTPRKRGAPATGPGKGVNLIQ